MISQAVAAAAARRVHGLKRVAILDWDVHHGNGTQHIFEDDPDVLFISLHRFGRGFFPGTGALDEVGKGKGRGRTINIPWMQAGLGDADYFAAFELVVMPILVEFAPQLLIVSAGFDAALGDPQGKCKMSPSGFAHLTRQLNTLSDCPLVAIFEGGYHLAVSAECTEAVLSEMISHAESHAADPDGAAACGRDRAADPSASGQSGLSRQSAPSSSCAEHTEQTLRQVIGIQREFWACLGEAAHASKLDAHFQTGRSRKRHRG